MGALLTQIASLTRFSGVLNLVQKSENLGNAAWTKTASSIGTPIVNDGYSLDLLIEDGTLGTHQATQGVSFVAGTTYTVSVLAKAKERSRFYLTLGASAFSGFAIGDMNLGAVTAVSVGGTAVTPSIYLTTNGVYVCTITATATATAAANIILQLHNGTTNSYTGDGASGLYIGAVQAEIGTVRTNYVLNS